MMSVMRHELVIRKKWMKEKDFISTMALTAVVPGPIAVNLAFLLGKRLKGRSGCAAAVLGTVLPSFCVILLIAMALIRFFDHPKAVAFFKGCTVAIVGQLAFTGLIFSKKLLRGWRQCVICATGLITVGALRLHPICSVILTSVLGYWLLSPVRTSGEEGSDAAYD